MLYMIINSHFLQCQPQHCAVVSFSVLIALLSTQPLSCFGGSLTAWVCTPVVVAALGHSPTVTSHSAEGAVSDCWGGGANF